MNRLRALVTRRRLATLAAIAVGLGVLYAARLWLFDGVAVTYTVAARLLALYGLGLLALFVWRDRQQAQQIDRLWDYLGELHDWFNGDDQAEEQADPLDRPTPAQQASPTVPDLAAQHPAPGGRHHAPDTT